jgi:peptidoglycan/xylan/chitin deacetylase (PgdA/CDA1 family)
VSKRLVLLGWHNVEPTHCFPSKGDRGRAGLAQQLRLLRRSANVVPLRSALRALQEGRDLPARAVALTFDDGYRDNLTVAGPMLRELGLPATCFVVPGILSRHVVPWWEELAWAAARARAGEVEWEGRRLALGTAQDRHATSAGLAEELKRRTRAQRETAVAELTEAFDPPGRYPVDEHFLDWDGARRLRAFMDIESHSTHHAILAEEEPGDQRRDLAEARRRIQDGIEQDTSVLAYPNGGPADFSGDTVEAARAAGYAHAVTTCGGLNSAATPPHEIRRTVLNPERGAVELAKIIRDAFGGPPGRHIVDPVPAQEGTPRG